jgi:molybdopterin biosynthesis enzyme
MILAEPLRNAHGSLIMDKGTVLTETFASRLAQRGISTVRVEKASPTEKNNSVLHTNDVQAITLEKLFEGKIVNNYMKMIYDALIKNRELNGGRQ